MDAANNVVRKIKEEELLRRSSTKINFHYKKEREVGMGEKGGGGGERIVVWFLKFLVNCIRGEGLYSWRTYLEVNWFNKIVELLKEN